MTESILKLLSTEQLFDPNPGPPSVYYGLIGFFFAAILGVSLSLYLRRKKLLGGQAALLKLATRVLTIGFIVGGVGVVLLLARFFAVPGLSMRILLYLWILVTLGLMVYLNFYIRRVQPRRREAYLRGKYGPKPMPRASAHKKKTKRRK